MSVVLQSSCSSKTQTPIQLEAQASQRTLLWLKKKYGLVNQPELKSYLNKVLARIASGTSTASLAIKIPKNQAAVYTTWRIYVLKHKEPNAFAIGDGSIVISDSLIRQCDNEAQLASIISHEMSHQMLGHIDKALSKQSEQKNYKSQPEITHTLQDEIDTDALGILLLELARYDAREAISALSIGYRRNQKGVSSKWIEKRASKMKVILGDTSFKYSTRNTRDFNRAKRVL